MNAVHLKVRPFKCKECAFSTTHSTALYTHNKRHKTKSVAAEDDEKEREKKAPDEGQK